MILFKRPSDKNMLPVVSSGDDDESMPEICDGYIIFANDSAMDFEISIR